MRLETGLWYRKERGVCNRHYTNRNKIDRPNRQGYKFRLFGTRYNLYFGRNRCRVQGEQ